MQPLTKELLRKLIHLTEVPIILGYSFLAFYVGKRFALLSLTGLLLLLLEFEYIRLEYQPKVTRGFYRLLSRFILRKKERNNIVGAIFFVASVIVSFAVFDYGIALLALSMAVFGDLTASIMGIAFGQKKVFKNKTYIGSISGFIINILLGWLLFPGFPEIFIPMAVVASFVETVTHKLDDNLTVPLFAGFTGQLLSFFFRLELPTFFGMM